MNPRIIEFIDVDVALALQNFYVARGVCDVLSKFPEKGPFPNVTLKFEPGPLLKGKQCGFFTTPVIITALIDIRRIVSFLGFGLTAGKLIKIDHAKTKKKPDDCDIADAGLPYPELNKFVSILNTQNIADLKLREALTICLVHANKAIAHVTHLSLGEGPLLGQIATATKGIEAALKVFLYDPLSRPMVSPKFTYINRSQES